MKRLSFDLPFQQRSRFSGLPPEGLPRPLRSARLSHSPGATRHSAPRSGPATRSAVEQINAAGGVSVGGRRCRSS